MSRGEEGEGVEKGAATARVGPVVTGEKAAAAVASAVGLEEAAVAVECAGGGGGSIGLSVLRSGLGRGRVAGIDGWGVHSRSGCTASGASIM